MGRFLLSIALVALVSLPAMGCGGGESTPAAKPPASDVPALALEGDPARGKTVWVKAGCGACHTLAAAEANGKIGPNLDKAQPSRDLVATRVTLGLKAMPTFEGLLSNQEIADVAAFVSSPGGL